ncbi:MAG: hypothetical protein ACYS0D_05185, partial [Planctomycetota bacterium]
MPALLSPPPPRLTSGLASPARRPTPAPPSRAEANTPSFAGALRDRERSRAPDAAEHPGSPTQTSPSADEAGPRTGAGTAAPAGGEAGTSETATAQQGASTAQDAQTTAQGTAEQPTATTDGQIPQTPIGVGAGLETQTPATPQAAAPAEQEAPTR